jgi:hypothetical protein
MSHALSVGAVPSTRTQTIVIRTVQYAIPGSLQCIIYLLLYRFYQAEGAKSMCSCSLD